MAHHITRAEHFFPLWVDACTAQHDVLYNDWLNCPKLTADIFNGPTSIIAVIAARLGLRSFTSYYHIDEVLFADEDLVPDIAPGAVWLRRIRVAFEHENKFKSGLFQELAHLLVTDCDLRVLVSYPDTDEELDFQLQYLHRIVSGSDRSVSIEEAHSLLFIIGWRDTTKGAIQWWGYMYEQAAWQRL